MATAYLSRTATTPTNNKKQTISMWVKRSNLAPADDMGIINFVNASSPTNSTFHIYFSNDVIGCFYKDPSVTRLNLFTTRKFRDTSAWYHIVFAIDTTQGTASNRAKLYVNGVQETSFTTSDYPVQDTTFLDSGDTLQVGRYTATNGNNRYFDGQLAHVHFVDGTAYTPSTFGETDSTTGIWVPKPSPTVTYGANGFFLKFDNSANMGLDSAGSNNLTTSGTIIQNKDTPSNNFAKLNFNDIAETTDITLANTGTTTMQTANVGDHGLRSTLAATTGKYYWEAKIATSNTLCILPMETRLVINLSDGSPVGDLYGVQRYSDSTSNIYDDGTFVQNTSAMWGGITSSDIISFALDLTNGKLFLAKNGSYYNQSGATGDPVNGTNPTFTISDTTKTYTFYTEMRGNDNNGTLVNFGDGYFGTTAVSSAQNPDDGAGIFEYDPPTGYRAWTTKGINAQEYS
mgnify:FL=1